MSDTDNTRSITEFLDEKINLFTIIGVFIALAVYLQTIYDKYPSGDLLFGIGSSLVLSIFISLYIFYDLLFIFNNFHKKLFPLDKNKTGQVVFIIIFFIFMVSIIFFFIRTQILFEIYLIFLFYTVMFLLNLVTLSVDVQALLNNFKSTRTLILVFLLTLFFIIGLVITYIVAFKQLDIFQLFAAISDNNRSIYSFIILIITNIITFGLFYLIYGKKLKEIKRKKKNIKFENEYNMYN